MSSKVRIISADTWRLRLLEEQSLRKHEEVMQLRDRVRQLRSQYELLVDMPDLKTKLDHATNSVYKLRIQILAGLGCEIADEKSIKAILANEAESFWSLVDEVKARPKKPLLLKLRMQHDDSGLESTEKNRTASNLPTLLVQQCTELDRLVESLGAGRNMRTLCKQSARLCQLAQSFE